MTPRIILLCLAVLGVPTMGEAAREERLAGRTPDLLFASGHKGRITGLAWSPDGKSLATSSADGSLRIWDPTLGATRRFSQEGRKISCIAWSPDGKRLAVGADGMVRVWSTTAWRLLQVLPEHDGLVTALSWRPDGLLLAAGDWHGKIRISNPETGAVRRLLSDEGGIIGQLAWNPNGKLLAAAGSWGRVAIWDLGTGQVRVRLPDVVGRVGWNPDGKILGVASRDGVRLWDLARGKIRYTIPRYEGWLLAWRPDWLMRAYDAEGRIRIEGAGLPPGGRDLGEHPDPGHGAWSADGKLLATAAIDGSVRIWEIPSGKCRFVLDNHGWGPEAFALSPDGKTFAISTEDGALHLWAPGEGEVRELRGHWNRVFALAWSPDGKRLASAGMDRTVRLWDAATGAAREVLTIDTELIRTLIWSPDGTRLILDDPGGAIRIWSPATDGVSRLKLQTRWSAGLVSSPDGKSLVSLGEKVALWDLPSGKSRPLLDGSATHGAWSRDGKILALADEDEAIRLCDPTTGEVRRVLKGGGSRLRYLAWAPDSTMLAASHQDGTLLVWAVVTGDVVRRLRGLNYLVERVTWSPDGADLWAATTGYGVSLWRNVVPQGAGASPPVGGGAPPAAAGGAADPAAGKTR